MALNHIRKSARIANVVVLGHEHLAAALAGLINFFKKLSSLAAMILIVRAAFLLFLFRQPSCMEAFVAGTKMKPEGL